MAAGDLTFTANGNELILCDVSADDIYSRIDAGRPGRLNTVDVAFPNTAGRELKIIGQQMTADTAFPIEYGSGGGFTTGVFKSNVAAMETFLGVIETFMVNSFQQIGTLTDRNDSYTGMRFISFQPTSDIRAVTHKNTAKVFMSFRAAFQRYTV